MAMLKYHTTSTTVGSAYRTKSSERNSQTRHTRSSAISAEKYKDFGTLKAARVINERIDEEDKNSAAGDEDDADDPVRASRRIANAGKKRNFLLKTILDQTKELCFEHATLYKDFESVYSKILLRFQQWELFDDEEVSLAC
jgi:hypothetical protein